MLPRLNVAILLIAVAAGYYMVEGLWIYAKAQLAQTLIAGAWQRTLATQVAEKPWPWADTSPVARLRWMRKEIDLYVLEGAQGSSLAFGPGHVQGSAYPGSDGVSIVGGHRDTHFRFLQRLESGDKLEVTARNGETIDYRVVSSAVLDSIMQPLLVDPSLSKLILVTCYPFNALSTGGPLRYVVTAIAENHPPSRDKPVQPISPV